jgi:hypothetical protein
MIRHDYPNSGGSTWRFKLNAGANPKQIDIPQRSSFTEPVYIMPGIYALEGETLKVCYRITNGERPNEFAAPRDSRRALLVLKRISTDPQAPKPTRPWQPPVGIVNAGMIQTHRQQTFVTSVNISADGKRLFTGGSGGIAEWDMKAVKFVRWVAKAEMASHAAVSADSTTAVFSTPLLTAQVVDVATGKELAKFRAPQLIATAISPDGKQVVWCSNVARLVEVAGGREQELAKGEADMFAHAVAFAPDGKGCYISRSGKMLVTEASQYGQTSPDYSQMALAVAAARVTETCSQWLLCAQATSLRSSD